MDGSEAHTPSSSKRRHNSMEEEEEMVDTSVQYASLDLSTFLWQSPSLFDHQFSTQAKHAIFEKCYSWLWQNEQELMRQYFYPDRQRWEDSIARLLQNRRGDTLPSDQLMSDDNDVSTSSYSREICGRLFRKGEPVYRCRTCALDDTCVLCSKCFNASNHDDHDVFVSISTGSGGCCDCSDAEAWKVPLHCSLHHHSLKKKGSRVPAHIANHIRTSIHTILEFALQVFAVTPEEVSLPRNNADIVRNGQQVAAALRQLGIPTRSPPPEKRHREESSMDTDDEIYACVVWNDEAHSFVHVCETIQQALECSFEEAKKVTDTIHIRGRCVLGTSSNLEDLRNLAAPLLHINLGVTIRPARDVFREQTAALLLYWLQQIAREPLPINQDGLIRTILCEELTMPFSLPKPLTTIVLPKSEDKDKDKEKKKDKEESGDDAHVDGEDTIMVDVSSAVAEEKVQVSSSASGIGPSSSSKTALPRGDIASIDWDPVPMVEEYRRLAVEEMEFDKMMLSERSNSNWSNQEETQRMAQDIQTEFEQTLQLDYFLLYDLRLWKEVRLALRELYIATLTTEAPYKKILGKRLTRNYARLAESFLFRDREPENAIILFSVQLLTVPSIAVLLVTEYHFFGLICSTLMAFFITEQIYYLPPVERRELPTRLNCDSRAFRTRRYFNSFHDIRYILNVDLLKPTIAQTPVYLRQFLDLIALFQAMNPQVRQKDTHVEYESDMWINAFNVTVQIAKSCRCFAECFKGLSADRIQAAQATIRAVARIINYIHEWGWGTEEEAGKPPPVPATTDCKYHTITFPHVGSLDVIDYDISSRPVSFHHPLHWLLAGILDAASWVDDQVLTAAGWNAPFEEIITKFKGEQSVDGALLPVFDFPIRTLAFSAQIRAGVWVRNGFSVKNQVLHYRDITLRESLYDSDVFLLQAALVTVDQNRVLATLIDRYNLVNWFSSKAEEHPVYDSTQMLFMVEDLLNIMIYCICERASALNLSHQERIRREIVHHLSLGQLLYSELTKRVSERMAEHPEFDAILQQVANFKAPNNLSDSGHYTLREEFFDLVDPYFHHFSRNNREEAERVLKARDKSAFVKPRPLQPINGIFRSLDNIIETSVFLQMIVYTLLNARNTEKCETILDEALHLTMIAAQNSASDGFIKFAVNRSFPFDVQDYTLFDVLVLYRNDEENYKDLHPEIDYIFNLMSQRGSQETKQVVDQYLEDRARIQKEKEDGNQELSELERKKKAAKERQKNIMDMFAQAQTAFLEQNEDFYDEDEEEEADMLGNANEASNAEPQPVVMYPTGTCIVCQEDVNERSLPYGMLGLLQISNMLQDAPADSKSMDAEILSRDTTLACEWPQQLAVDEYAGRTPLSGRKTGLYASTCGHLMHIKCFESYCASIDARHTSQLQRNHPENRQRKEFTCPLCKALGNMVLPIIWKGQAETYPGPSDEESYQRFLNTDVHFIAEKLQYSIDPNRPIGFGVWNANGGNMLFAPRLPSLRGAHVESRIPSLSSILGTAAAEQQERLQHRLGPPAMLIKSAVGIIPAIEKIYGRLSSVLSTILDICGSESTKPLSSSIKYVDSLWGTLGYTIACLEIATRGQPLQEDQYTVFDQITSSQQTLLRIFCDTIIAYTHLMCQQDQPSMGSILFQIPATKSDSSVMIQVHGLALQRMLQIFAVDPAAATQIGAIENTLYDNPPLLADDPFMILSELSMHLIPVAHADIYPFIRILFLAEISRVVAGLLPRLAESSSDGNVSIDIDDNDAPAVGRLAKFIASQLSIQQHQPSLDSKLARLLKTYALPFLRRTAVLISARFGVTLPRPSSLRTNEFEQLLEILQLPNLTDLITHADTERLVRGWCTQLLRDDSVAAQLVLDRPTPYSLIPLARRLDTLINESMQHTCSRCNSVPTDPALCLLCGTFVCSQSFCCSEGEEGECNLHMFECGGEIGIYLLIKRCSLLLLHNENGWFLQAPYLDTHGEVDQGLRRGRPQYLNTKRYADIRKLWLQHGIPSYIARQIEATFDVGGWTTL